MSDFAQPKGDAERAEAPGRKATKSAATILIVDDHAPSRQYLTSLLAYKGHRLLEASDGAEALASVRVERPDLVISDILMPTMDMSSFVNCAVTKNRCGEPGDAIRCKELGVAAYLSKPFDRLELRDVLLHVLAGNPVW